MKELSIEEKAKAYDDRLEKARKWYDANTNEGYRGIFEDIFPELKDSDDERIRKELLAWLKSRDGQTLPIDRYNAAIAWLEKQGDIVKNNMLLPFKEYDNLMDSINKKKKEGYEAGYKQGLSDSKSEQRPILNIETPFGAKDSELQEASYHIPEGFHVEIEGNRVVIKRGEQEPEWTPMDEQHVENLLAIIEGHGYTGEVAWLKSLKDRVQPQPKQKWSEEDERIVTKIVGSLSAYADKLQYEGFCHNSEVLYEQIDWLKSLRPQSHWKPSDEHIEALERIVNFAHFDEVNNRDIVKNLLSQLKKLRE